MLATRPVTASRRSSELHHKPVPRDELQALLDDAGLRVAIREVGWSTSIRCNTGSRPGSVMGVSSLPATPLTRIHPRLDRA
jgi:hypothetical protein